MPEAMHEVVLSGCTPEPLMNYLKALGILRLIAEDREHGDPGARGFWRDDVFVLRSRLDEKMLEAFFLEHYRPTPIVAPWGARSGFFPGGSEKTARLALDAIAKSTDERLSLFRDTVVFVRDLLQSLSLTDKAEGEEKTAFLVQCRSSFPDHLLPWVDACYVLTADDRKFPPLLGTGGNEGSGSYVSGFAQQVVQCIIEKKYSDALRPSLFASIGRVDSDQTPGHFSGRAAGGPNASQGFEGSTSTNPWDYLLCLEGSCLWASALVRRFGQAGSGMAAFPFTVNVAGAGSTSLTTKDGRKPKQAKREIAELWLPLWDAKLALVEIQNLLGEGRASIGSRPALNGTEMARAAATLGVDRGIREFARTSFLMRNGQSFLSISLGRFRVGNNLNADLLREIDPWLDSFRLACSGDGVPPRFPASLRAIDSAVFDFCRYGGSTHFRSILIALGAAERELASGGRFREENPRLTPLAGLSSEWIAAARPNDSQASMEFEIALALASIRAADGEQGKVGSLRSNLEPVSTWYDTGEQRTRAKWAEKDRAVVCKAADLSTNLAAVLTRRVMDGERTGCKDLPLASRHGATPAAITAFLRSELDEHRIEELLWGLMLVDSGAGPLKDSTANDTSSLPLAYCLFKLLFLPRGLVNMASEQDKPRWRLAGHDDEHPVRIRPEPRILALLRTERVREAATIAIRRLWVSGLALWCSHASHNRQCQVVRSLWASGKLAEHLAFNRGDGRRLAAALLIPISHQSVGLIAQQATSLKLWTDATS